MAENPDGRILNQKQMSEDFQDAVRHVLDERGIGGGGGGGMGDLENRVQKLEANMDKVQVSLARIETKLDHVATHEDLQPLRSDIENMKGQMGKLPGTWTLVGIMASLALLVLAAVKL